MLDLDKMFTNCRCSECLRQGTLHLNTARYMFQCEACGAEWLNPWDIGPWEYESYVLDTKEDDVVSSYKVTEKEPEGEVDIQPERLLFAKYLVDTGRLVKEDA